MDLSWDGMGRGGWLLWAGGVLASLAGAALFMRDLWRTASETPTATSVATTHHPLSSVPFPAVTVCPINRVQAAAAARFYSSSGLESAGLSKQAYNQFLFNMVDMALPEESTSVSEDAIAVQTFLMAKNYTLGSVMKQVTQPCEEMALQCRWRGKSCKCKELFRRQKTDAGYCCSFNYESVRTNAAGLLSGVTVLLDPQLEDYQAATFSFYGFQVLVHSPVEFPDVIARGHIVKPASEAFLQVTAEQTMSTDAVRRLSLQQRQCLYPNEGGYATARIDYSRSNCLTACRARHMMRRCRCVPYFYPSVLSPGRECALADLPCLANNSWFFSSFKPDSGEVSGDESGMSCECYPGCFDIAYYLSATSGWLFQSQYDTTKFL
ncbi:sodium channel protein Nach-like [Schistocerca serialis cubense]|uniref:sodium channel protein Nach-like n=1 Tax=Schistocerca serialis cubense TaxID=2023355 RepID=UPI00214F27CA|nr:sodium channel protein Nach-like [Schistocerca serialis cubense]